MHPDPAYPTVQKCAHRDCSKSRRVVRKCRLGPRPRRHFRAQRPPIFSILQPVFLHQKATAFLPPKILKTPCITLAMRHSLRSFCGRPLAVRRNPPPPGPENSPHRKSSVDPPGNQSTGLWEILGKFSVNLRENFRKLFGNSVVKSTGIHGKSLGNPREI